MKTLLIKTFLTAALAVTPAAAAAFVSVEVSGPAGSRSAFGEFLEQAWGRAATGTIFTPNASVHEGLRPAGCCVEALGGDANAFARVDGTKGLAGASAFAQHPGEDNDSSAEAGGVLRDELMFLSPLVTIDMDLIGSVFFNVTGDAEGSYLLEMQVNLEADNPSNPDLDIGVYDGSFSIWRNFDGTRGWSMGSSVSGFLEGTGSHPPFHLSDTFLVPAQAAGLPVRLFMNVFASADCVEGTGLCSTSAQGFNTGYLGIKGNYTSTHSYPGLATSAIPEPQTFVLFGLGLAALIGVRFRRQQA